MMLESERILARRFRDFKALIRELALPRRIKLVFAQFCSEFV